MNTSPSLGVCVCEKRAWSLAAKKYTWRKSINYKQNIATKPMQEGANFWKIFSKQLVICFQT